MPSNYVVLSVFKLRVVADTNGLSSKTIGCNDCEPSDEEPLCNTVQATEPTASNVPKGVRPSYRWRKKVFQPPILAFTGAKMEAPANQNIKTPYQYFQQFVTADMIDGMVDNTNLYSTQKMGKSINTTKKEVEQMMGMYFHMGLVRMSSVRQYWKQGTNYVPVSSVMPRNRFQQLATQLYFVNNSSILDEQKKDKLWKIRPWLDSLRDQCLKVTAEERNSIDEMMVQYRGTTSPIRQYIKSKPLLWAFKVWGRAGTSGMLFYFDIYQSGDGTRSHLGQGGDVVMKLVFTLEKNSNYKIYADNLFTSVPLLEKLLG
ncbi:piggyBac transposable element-derived protein 3-like [Watersipora subatra]|uniref:piggyBac transposable element-derived protein 3-like n=1 Tax=Watersipora subatra TaxID=2589382 RepID=UPI00355AE908